MLSYCFCQFLQYLSNWFCNVSMEGLQRPCKQAKEGECKSSPTSFSLPSSTARIASVGFIRIIETEEGMTFCRHILPEHVGPFRQIFSVFQLESIFGQRNVSSLSPFLSFSPWQLLAPWLRAWPTTEEA